MSKSKSKKSQQSDIQIKVIDFAKIDNSYNNFLILNFSGSDINNVIINTLRRVIMELVPIYAFETSNIEISKNTSIYNNDYMRLRLSNFPVYSIDNNIETIKQSANLEYEANISKFEKKIEDINIIAEKEQAYKLEKAQNFIININCKNTTSEILSVTTSHKDIRYYYQTKMISTPYIRPLLILKLKPGEEFIGSLTSTLGISLSNSNFMPTSVCAYEEVSENSFNFNIESLKQLTEIEIIIRACQIIIIKLNNFLEIFINKIKSYSSEKIVDEFNLENQSEKSSTESESITDSAIRNTSDDVLEQHRVKSLIQIENESHTFGNLLSKLLQDHPAILFAAYKIDHLLIKELSLAYKTDGTDIIIILEEIINKGKNIFEDISTKLEKITLE
jgi:DNA-directed RNA polymerase subunit L